VRDKYDALRNVRAATSENRIESLTKAEGMGFEPTTHCWASDFESDRWPVRLPSEAKRHFSDFRAPSQAERIRRNRQSFGPFPSPHLYRKSVSIIKMTRLWQRGFAQIHGSFVRERLRQQLFGSWHASQ
jgi:hypothetical protein